MNLDMKIKAECRDKFIENDQLLDNYLALNFDDLTKEHISILTGFKQKITGDFIIYKCLTNHAVFLNAADNKFYAVKALGDRFDEYFDKFPVLIRTTLLPYNGKIIYDGFVKSSGVCFGSGITSTIKDEYMKAKKQNSILTTLSSLF